MAFRIVAGLNLNVLESKILPEEMGEAFLT